MHDFLPDRIVMRQSVATRLSFSGGNVSDSTQDAPPVAGFVVTLHRRSVSASGSPLADSAFHEGRAVNRTQGG